MTFFNQLKVQGINQKRGKVKKIGAICKIPFPIQDLYQRSGRQCAEMQSDQTWFWKTKQTLKNTKGMFL